MTDPVDVRRSDSAARTEAIGARLAAGLEPGDVVLISGELGAGKTTLIRGACRELGVTEPVVSPTFTIGRRYRGRVRVSHLDLFRLDGLDDEDPGLLDDYASADAITFVEWPDAAESAFDDPARDGSGAVIRVALSHEGGDERRVTISAPKRGRPG
ncbi:MAG: tRNA (adenosine(37)-N6)-threonylcarbamoyltransferase complex ATPase subunit type 1 TsaE [Solirubrobacterales bacterium]